MAQTMESQKQPHTVEDGVEVSTTSSGKVDDNYDIYKRYQGIEYTEEEAKRVLRKIDCRVVPILFLIYLIQYLDKNSLNFASVYGLKTATKLEGQDYSWLGGYFLLLDAGIVLMQFRIDILYRIPRRPMASRICLAETADWEVSQHHDIQ